MPVGLVLWEWDSRIGAEILEKYPESADISEKTMMQLYSQHLYTGTADLIELYTNKVNIISIWTGQNLGFYLSLLLQPDENSEEYVDLLTDTIYYLLPYIQNNTYKTIFKSLFHRFEEYSQTSEEQRLAILYTGEINQHVLNLLMDEGCYFKEEINIWLNDKLNSMVFDFDMIIERLSKAGLIKMSNVQDVEGNYLFLTKTIFIFRAPLTDIDFYFRDNLSEEDKSNIKEEIKKFFLNYKPSDVDAFEIASVLSKKDYYSIINLLRSSIIDENAVEKLNSYEIENPFELLNELEELNIAGVYSANNTTYYYLKSNIIVDSDFPEFMFEKILDFYETNRKNKKVLLEYLEILRRTYIKQKAVKAKSKFALGKMQAKKNKKGKKQDQDKNISQTRTPDLIA